MSLGGANGRQPQPGHAIILLEPGGENSIVVHPGANHVMELATAKAALAGAEIGDLLLLQNEVVHVPAIAEYAMGLGMEVIYSAAPFEPEAAKAVLPFTNILILNAVEAAQLRAALGTSFDALPVETVIVTKGAEGAELVCQWQAGYTCPGAVLHRWLIPQARAIALRVRWRQHLTLVIPRQRRCAFAAAAAGLQVGRAGAAPAMPTRAEIDAVIGDAVG